jgi:hypothetical protein
VLIAEGVETALSVKAAGIQGTILCSLGSSNLKNLDLHGKEVVLLADWDGGYDKPSWQTLQKAQQTLQQKNTSVSIVLPCENPALMKQKLDFNDVLKQDGLSSLQALLVTQGLKDEPARTHPKEEGIISHEQTEQPSQARSAAQTDHDHLAAAQQENTVDAFSGKAAKGIQEEKNVTTNPPHLISPEKPPVLIEEFLKLKDERNQHPMVTASKAERQYILQLSAQLDKLGYTISTDQSLLNSIQDPNLLTAIQKHSRAYQQRQNNLEKAKGIEW